MARFIKHLLVLVVLGSITGGAYIYSGAYHIGADVPHNNLTYWILETLRERSISSRAKSIDVPELKSPDLLLAGGPDYNEMCSSCHLKPGKMKSDMSLGLYPTPPNLSLPVSTHEAHGHDDASQLAQRQFWIIKHGIKASGMPAWGPTHDDQRIWAMVAFLQKLPELTPEQYQVLTARAEGAGHGEH